MIQFGTYFASEEDFSGVAVWKYGGAAWELLQCSWRETPTSWTEAGAVMKETDSRNTLGVRRRKQKEYLMRFFLRNISEVVPAVHIFQ